MVLRAHIKIVNADFFSIVLPTCQYKYFSFKQPNPNTLIDIRKPNHYSFM